MVGGGCAETLVLHWPAGMVLGTDINPHCLAAFLSRSILTSVLPTHPSGPSLPIETHLVSDPGSKLIQMLTFRSAPEKQTTSN